MEKELRALLTRDFFSFFLFLIMISSDQKIFLHSVLQLAEKQILPLYYDSLNKHIKARRTFKQESGTFRHCLIWKDCVIKFPKNIDGIIDNIFEAHIWKNFINGISLDFVPAPCRLLPDLSLLMRRVHESDEDISFPDWHFTIDASQIGYIKNKPLAFDYALTRNSNLNYQRIDFEHSLNIKNSFFQNTWLKKINDYPSIARVI